MTFCKNYRAMVNCDTCEAGVDYGKWYGLPHDSIPCFRQDGDPCEHQNWPTKEELAAEEAEIEAMLKQFQADLEADICPHCKTPIAHKRQVGRCVYADPCGCRLYQGRL